MKLLLLAKLLLWEALTSNERFNTGRLFPTLTRFSLLQHPLSSRTHQPRVIGKHQQKWDGNSSQGDKLIGSVIELKLYPNFIVYSP